MSTPADMDDDDRVFAAEYVLGLMDADAVRAFEARMSGDPMLRAQVVAWAEDFSAMTDEIPEETPPPGVFTAIASQLFGPAEADEPSLWQRLGLGWIIPGAVAAAALAFFVVNAGLLTPDFAPEYVAEVTAEDASVHFTASYDADTGNLHLVRHAGEAAPGRSLEFWLIAGDSAPVSVMVWPTGSQEEEIILPAPVAAALPGGTLAISDEPEGGSPSGAPTGTVLAHGQISDA